MNFQTIKRKWRTEFLDLPWKWILLTAGCCLFLGILTACSGITMHPIHYCIPKRYPPLFLIVCIWFTEYFLIGIGFGIFLFTKRCRKDNHFYERCALFLCALIVSYTWIPLILRGGNPFMGILTCLALCTVLIFLFLSLRFYTKIIAGSLIISVCQTFYILFFTLSLWLLNR